MAVWRRAALKAGVYDEIVSARLDRQLAALGDAFDVHRAALRASEPIGAVLESLLADGVALALAELKADSGKGIALAEALLAVLGTHAPGVFERDDELRLHAERLTAIVARPAQVPERPRGSLHASSLIVNAEGDRLLEHLRSEFDSADSIDLLCAFVKLSGFERFRSSDIQREQLPIGEPGEISRPVDNARIDAADFRRRPQPLHPRADVLVVLRDRMAVRRREDDVQALEAPESREVVPEELDDPAVARQQRQHVGVEGESRQADKRHDQRAEYRADDEEPLAMGPPDDGPDHECHAAGMLHSRFVSHGDILLLRPA